MSYATKWDNSYINKQYNNWIIRKIVGNHTRSQMCVEAECLCGTKRIVTIKRIPSTPHNRS